MPLLFLLFSMPSNAEFGLVALVLLAGFFWIKMIIDIATSNFVNKDSKIIWLLITFFLGFLGAVIYYFAGRDGRVSKTT
jgi:hypothetical protein